MTRANPNPEWMDDAACADVDPDLFFPKRGDSVTMRRAKAVCDSCPVKVECLDYAMAEAIKFGVWGGMSERQRRRMRRDNAAALRVVPQ